MSQELSVTAKEKLIDIANTSDLTEAIKKLEIKRKLQEEGIRDHVHDLLISLKPTNILKQTIEEVRESTSLKHNLLKVALGLGAGYFSRKMIVGKSAGVVKKALGAALQYGITNFVAKKPMDESGYDAPYPKQKKSLFRRILSI
ncbi:MAG: hypothetical protein JSS98_03905 [Bacteroidetes bacterium]|nr:hypothetical protein [Bacteroidota bacterium]